MNKKIKTVLRCVLWFIVSFVLVWISGIGLLFENNNPLQALLIFAALLTVIFESINQVDLFYKEKTQELEKRIEELEMLKKE